MWHRHNNLTTRRRTIGHLESFNQNSRYNVQKTILLFSVQTYFVNLLMFMERPRKKQTTHGVSPVRKKKTAK